MQPMTATFEFAHQPFAIRALNRGQISGPLVLKLKTVVEPHSATITGIEGT